MKKILLFILPFLYCLILLFHQDVSFTQDLGRHIRTGEIIWNIKTVPATNLFSYTLPNQEFINHHWGSEVLFYLLYSNFGPNSLLVSKVILIFLSFGIVFYVAFKKNPFWATLIAFPLLYIFSYRFYVRPELFSFLFISLFVYLILKYQETKEKLSLLFLVPIEFLWVNMHIYFVLGPLFYFLFLIADFIKNKKINLALVLIFIGLILATFINPYGAKGAIEPFVIFNNYGYSIVENQSIIFLNQFFFNSQIFVFEVVAILFVILVVLNFKKLNLFLILISFFAVISGFKIVRNFPIFVLSAITIFPDAASLSLAKIRDEKAQKNVQILSVFLISIFVLVTSYSSSTSPDLGFSFSKGAEGGVNYLQKHKLKGQIFNNFDIGSYLIFRLYPQRKVFVDGRPEAYSVKFFNDYKKMQEDPNFFDTEAKKYKINTVFFTITDITPWAQEFLVKITKNPKWKQVYLDNSVIILTRK